MENRISLVFDDRQKEDIRASIAAMREKLNWTLSLTKEEILAERRLSLNDLGNMKIAFQHADSNRNLFEDPSDVDEFRKDIDAHEFVASVIALLEEDLRKMRDTEIRLRQEIDDFARYARDQFVSAADRKPKYKSAAEFFTSIFNKKLGKRTKDEKPA